MKKNDNPDPASEAVATALLQEHEELVTLFTHDDLISWQLNLALLAANAGLLTGVQTQGAFDLETRVGLPLWVILAVGIVVNVAGFLAMQRRRVYRMSRLLRALRVEDELARAGYPIQTFTSAEGNIALGRALVWPSESPPPPAPQLTRALRLVERITVFDLRLVFYSVAVLFLLLAVWVFVGRPVS